MSYGMKEDRYAEEEALDAQMSELQSGMDANPCGQKIETAGKTSS